MYAKTAEDLSVQFVGEAGSAKPAGQLRVLPLKPRVGLLSCSGFSAIPTIFAGASLIAVGMLLGGSSGGCLVWPFPLIGHLRLGFRNKLGWWRNYLDSGFRCVANGLLVSLSSEFSGKRCGNDYSEVD